MWSPIRLIMLALVQGRSWSQITSDLGCSRSSIDKASRVLRSTGMDEDTINALSAQELSELFPDNRRRDLDAFVEPDFAGIAARRRRGERVTLKVEHHKYTRRQAASGQQHYSYRQFCALFENYVDVNDLTALLTHAPGEELCVDWSGETMAVVDPLTGVSVRACVFVASLPHSGLIHASAWPDMRMRSWLCAHRDALDYIGGVPVRIVPDNASTATNQVIRGATVREVNERYQQFAEFYGCGITPARPGKPREKAHVEKRSISSRPGSQKRYRAKSSPRSTLSTPLLRRRSTGSTTGKDSGAGKLPAGSCLWKAKQKHCARCRNSAGRIPRGVKPRPG